MRIEVETVSAQEALRADIQALRGVAILLVVLHHARLVPGLTGGYLGVDIFFVVSGFLITRIIARDIKAGGFSFAGFFARRAWRLLPAAYVTFAACLIVAPLFLTGVELTDFTWQLVGAVTFTANIVLWMQTGYFEAAAGLKPLLHTWSLSIEEQYYVLLPVALVLLPRRLWAGSILMITLSSLALCMVLVDAKPGATFYLLPTRAWELALGSFGALVAHQRLSMQLSHVAYWPAIFTLIAIPIHPIGSAHPGIDALLICVATLVVLLRNHERAQSLTWLLPLVWLGRISYSLYLTHWPLFAFTANAFVKPVPIELITTLLFVALGVSWLLNRYVEEPLRRPSWRRSRSATLALASFTVALPAVAMTVASSRGGLADAAPSYARTANIGLDPTCDAGDGVVWRDACTTSAAPTLLLWGDSYAMHIAQGLSASGATAVWQATRSACGPMVDLSMYTPRGLLHNEAWAQDCIDFNARVLEMLPTKPSVDVVVLASLFDQYLSGYFVVSKAGAALQYAQGGPDLAVAALVRTVRAVRAAGKRVVVVAPPPSSAARVDLGRCVELLNAGRLIWGADREDCGIDEAAYRREYQERLSMLARAAELADVDVYWPHDVLCVHGVCPAVIADVPLYRDAGHLSNAGSRQYGMAVSLATTLQAMAR